jgi:hypothetical protein
MPIRFRCGYCSRLLGIARRKAGTNTTCPHCGATIAVPSAVEFEGAGDGGGSQPELAEIDQLLQASGSAVAARPATVASPAPNVGFSTTPTPEPTPAPAALSSHKPSPTPAPTPPPRELLTLTEPEKPRIERDVDTALGGKTPAPESRREPKPVPSPDSDALSLDDELTGYVLTPRTLTGLAVVVVVLLVLAFTAGYFVGAR